MPRPIYLAAARLAARARKYSPDQPRAPAGNPAGGQWTNAGNGNAQTVPDKENSGKTIGRAANRPEALVPPHPRDVDVDKNITMAEAMKPFLPPPVNLLWFYDQVRNKGPWDYKQLDRVYADFGNFNYGASGAALGISDDTLLRAAGWAQSQSGNSGAGVAVGPAGAILGIGGEPPFGDDPQDQDWIKRGIQYYRTRRKGR